MSKGFPLKHPSATTTISFESVNLGYVFEAGDHPHPFPESPDVRSLYVDGTPAVVSSDLTEGKLLVKNGGSELDAVTVNTHTKHRQMRYLLKNISRLGDVAVALLALDSADEDSKMSESITIPSNSTFQGVFLVDRDADRFGFRVDGAGQIGIIEFSLT